MNNDDETPDEVLEAALEMDLSEVIVIGINRQGRTFLGTSRANPLTIIKQLDKAKRALIKSTFN